MQPKEIACRYSVRALNESDVAQVYRLLCGNSLFYEYHPPRPTEESVLSDMRALPNVFWFRRRVRIFCGKECERRVLQ